MNTDGIMGIIAKEILPIVLAVIGVGIIAASRKKDMSGTMTQFIIVCVGCIVIAGAGLFFAFGDSLARVVFTG